MKKIREFISNPEIKVTVGTKDMKINVVIFAAGLATGILLGKAANNPKIVIIK